METLTRVDYYAILGISRNASIEEIREAYFRLAEGREPGAGINRQSAPIAAIAKAYEELSDPDRRLIYNQLTGKAHKVIYCPFCSDYDPEAWETSSAGNATLTMEGVHVTVFQYKKGPGAGGWGFVYGKSIFWQGKPFATEAEAKAAGKAALARSVYHCCT